MLLLGALALLAWNPYTLLDAGFQLSFAAVAAIFVLVPRDLRRAARGLPAPGRLRAPSPSRPRAASRPRRSCGSSSTRSRCCRAANVLAAPAVGRCSRSPSRRRIWPRSRRRQPRARVAERLVRRLPRRAARASSRRSHARRSGRPAASSRSPAPSSLAAYACRRWRRAEAGLPPHGRRPAEDRARARAAARPVRRRRGRAPHAAATSGGDAVAACNALGLFGGDGRLVLVDGVERGRRRTSKAVAAYLGRPRPGPSWRSSASELKKDSPLAKAVAKAGDLLLYDVAEARPAGLGARAVRAPRGAGRPGRVPRLVELVGDDLYELARDREARDVGGRRAARAADVEQLAAPRARGGAFALTDAWGARDVARCARRRRGAARAPATRAARRARRASSRATSPACAPARRSRPRACPPKDGRVAAEAAPVRRREAFAQARNYDDEELRAATVRLAELDHALKGGSRLAGELELERALVEIAQPAARRQRLALARRSRRARRRAAPPAPSCARPCSGGARPWPPPGRSSGRARGARLRRARRRPRRPRREPALVAS